MLKRLAIHAARTFEKEVKAKQREGLTEDELVEREPEDDEPEAPAKAKGQGKGRLTGVQQAKIVRQQDRVDPVTGKGRSRGYGFLEMTTHADALRVLRWANNNADVGKLFDEWWKEELADLIKLEKGKASGDGRLERFKKEQEEGSKKKAKGSLIMEFSIENVQVVKRRAAHQQEQKVVSLDSIAYPGSQLTLRIQPSSGPESKKTHRRPSLPPVKTESKDDDRPQKKQRTSGVESRAKVPPQTEESGATSPSKSGGSLGSLIGRKRKERKGKKGKA